jgi:hypothetical protein
MTIQNFYLFFLKITIVTSPFFINLKAQIMPKDLIINELLIDPEPYGARFIEIFNRSDNKINMVNIKIADALKKDVKTISTPYILLPKQYVVITDDPVYIQNRYNVKQYSTLIIKNKLPTWATDKGKIVVYYNNLSLDSFSYDKSMHNPLLADTEGVSLERISPDNETNSKSSWHSAAANRGYATPAYQNSQYNDTPSVSNAQKDFFSFQNTHFSPDDDGFEDSLLVNYNLNKIGYLANIYIFDIKGSLLKTLKMNELLSVSGTMSWDGVLSEGVKAPSGIYILYIELAHPEGYINKLKKPFSIISK